MHFLEKYKASILLVLLTALYFYFAYFLERTSYWSFATLWISLFTASYFLYRDKQEDAAFLTAAAVLFRLAFLFALPNLSQDFYRFIWDGRMLAQGYNPYLSLPQTFIEQHEYPIAQAVELYEGMGSLNGSHYTNYPPINQLCFWIASTLSGTSILGAVGIMRALIILADIGIIIYGKKILQALQLPKSQIYWYALNPFVIIELTGNLHFEPVMLFFMVASIYYLLKNKWLLSAFLLAASVAVKLIPLLFLPLFLPYFLNAEKHWKTGLLKTIGYTGMVLLSTLLFFIPFIDGAFIANYSNSVGLWFRNFEFNASLYYIARAIGYWFRGYNEIAIIGKIMPVLALLFLGYLTFRKQGKDPQYLLVSMLFGLSFYYFTSTTVHPWYVATPLILTVFTRYTFPIVWSAVLILSYQAYANTPWQEHLWIIALEYLLLFGYLIYELRTVKGGHLFSK